MSRFYADIQGSRGEATRQGTAKSGIEGHVRGWHTGVKVRLYVDEKTGKDVVVVYQTSGSGGHTSNKIIATWTEEFTIPSFYK